ncbi:MAG: hypothetical protein WB509_08670 [Acetobacteraceae bacterium]
MKATIAVAASSPAPSVTQANLANLNSAAAEVPMNAAVTSQIYTSLTDTTAVSTHGYSAPNAPESGVPAAAEDGGHACLIDYDTPCKVLR